MNHNIRHTTSSPRYPQSNGKAEAAVKVIKNFVKKCRSNRKLDHEAFRTGLLAYRNTPLEDGNSPAEVLYGRRLQDSLPWHRDTTTEACASSEPTTTPIDRKARLRQHYNRSSRPLPPIARHTNLLVQAHDTKRWTIRGTVVKTLPNRSYVINTRGHTIVRNRRQIRPHVPLVPLPHRSEHSKPTPHPDTNDLSHTPAVVPTASPSGHNNQYITRSGRLSRRPQRYNDFLME